MNPLDHSLQRLFRAAARARAEEPKPIPGPLAARILAQWRRAAAVASPVIETDLLGALFRRGLLWACAIMLLSVAWNWPADNAEPVNDLTLINDVVQESTTP